MVVTYCCVQSCWVPYGNLTKKHRFPNPETNPALFNKWLKLCGNKKLQEENTPENIYKNFRVCHKHFDKNDFESDILKCSAFPHINMPIENVVERPKVVKNILKDLFRLPTLRLDNKKSNEITQSERDKECSRIPTKQLLLADSDKDAQTYVLDQSDFASLPLQCIENTSDNASNVQEIVINEKQVHFLNKQTTSDGIGSVVCRTCLALAPRDTCKKLFDMKNTDESDHLREKINYIAGDIDFNMSIDPVVCSKCVTILDIAVGFKRKITEAEKRINERSYLVRGVKTLVNLRSLLETNSENVLEIDDNEKGVTIVNKSKSEVIIIANSGMGTASSQNDNPLDNYLTNREKVLEKFFSENPVVEKPRPTGHIPRTHFANFDIPPDSDTPNLNVALQKPSTSTGVAPNKTVLGVTRLERKLSSSDLFSNLRLKVTRTDKSTGKKWAVSKADGQYTNVTPETPITTVDSDNPGYKYLFNKPRKKKPPVPKTFDLFDEAHDQYFRDLEGTVGYHMAAKWAKFGRRLPPMGTGPFLCDICGVTMKDKKNFQIHCKHKHSIPADMCSYCGQIFRVSQNLRNHIMSKHKPPTFQCKICGKMFHLRYLLKTHVKAVHCDKKIRYQCHECGQLVTKGQLRHHKDKHSSNTYACDVCQKVFNVRYDMHRHRYKHFRRYKCRFCPVDFSSDSSMRQHVKQIHEGLRWQCLICGRLLRRKEYLVPHCRAAHGGQVPRWKKRYIVDDNGGEKVLAVNEVLGEEEELELNKEVVECQGMDF